MENQIKIINQNNQQTSQNSINQLTTQPEGSQLNYRLLLSTLLVFLFLGVMGLLIINLQSKKGQDQIGQPVGQPESTSSPYYSQTPQDLLVSPSKKKTILFKENSWKILFENKEYSLPFPNITVSPIELRAIQWSPDEQYLFVYLPFFADNLPKYVGKLMFISLPPKNIESVWEKNLEAEEPTDNYLFQGAIFSPSNKLYLVYEESQTRAVSVVNPDTQGEKERIVKKETFERGFLAHWVPINISPKESYLLILQAYELVDEPLILLNTKTGEFIDMHITINIENRDFVWSSDEKSVVFTYEKVKDWDVPQIEYQSGKVRYNLETHKLEYL